MFYSCFTQRPHCFWNLLDDFMHAGEKIKQTIQKTKQKKHDISMNESIDHRNHDTDIMKQSQGVDTF